MSSKILFSEDNFISLRTAFVGENENLVGLRLTPAAQPGDPSGRVAWMAKTPRERLLEDFVWLYRRSLSASDEAKIMSGPPCVAQKVKAISFEGVPKFRLRWTDSGEGVALFLNGEPWAFIDESNHNGYSKGMTNSIIGNQWNQPLFEKLFGT